MQAKVDLDGAAPAGYRLVGLVGFGPTGQVWRAREETSGAEVALRLVRQPAGSAGAVAARLRELSGRLDRLAHPHLLRLRRVLPGQRDGQVWCVADLAPGGSLAALLARRAVLSPGEVVTIGVPVAEALQALHARGMSHGALHPANILLTAAGRPLLADAGLAEALAPVRHGGPLLDRPGQSGAGEDASGRHAEVAALAGLLGGCLGQAGVRSDAARPEAKRVLGVLHAAQSEAASAGRLAETLRTAADPAPVRLLGGAGSTGRPLLRRGRESPTAGPAPRQPGGHSRRRPRPRRSAPSRRAVLLTAVAGVVLLGGGLRLAGMTWAEESGGSAKPLAATPATEPVTALTESVSGPVPTTAAPQTAPETAPETAREAAGLAALAGPDPVAALQALDAARSAALARLDAALLGSLYLPDVPARAADLALVRGLVRAGEWPDGFRSEVREAEVLRRDDDSATLRVTDVVPPFAVRDGDGALLRMDPGRGERVFEVDLARCDGLWCYAASRAVEVG